MINIDKQFKISGYYLADGHVDGIGVMDYQIWTLMEYEDNSRKFLKINFTKKDKIYWVIEARDSIPRQRQYHFQGQNISDLGIKETNDAKEFYLAKCIGSWGEYYAGKEFWLLSEGRLKLPEARVVFNQIKDLI